MYILFSGERSTDLGTGTSNAVICEGDAYAPGPMAVIVDQVVEQRYEYSTLALGLCGYVSEQRIVERAAELKADRKAVRLPGKRQPQETRYFFINARMLAQIAKEKQNQRNEDVVAVLFRDSDGTASAGRGLWSDQRQSMLDGFRREEFSRGVPMIPKPKSEAWLICALKPNPYRDCEKLERRSGNDRSPRSLKRELERLLKERPSRERLCAMVERGTIDVARIVMPSFAAFRSRLEEVLRVIKVIDAPSIEIIDGPPTAWLGAQGPFRSLSSP